MYCFDTSFLAPLILEEETSAKIETKFATLDLGALYINRWTSVEFASLIAREVRMGGLSESDANTALLQFDTLIGASFRVLQPEAADYELARLFIQNFATKLRAGDALHLAVAHNRNARVFYTLDKTLLHAALLLKIKASTL